MSARVECHSGSGYAERPTALYWQDQRLQIEQIAKEWYTPEGKYFLVRTEDGQTFELGYQREQDHWQIRQT